MRGQPNERRRAQPDQNSDDLLELLARALAAQLAIEGTRSALVETAVQSGGKIVERLSGDGGEIEVTRLVEWRPYEIDEFGLRVDDALDPLGDKARVDDQEARVEAPGASRRRDRARKKVNVVERWIDAGRGEPGPYALRRFGGSAVVAHADRKPGFF